MFESILDFRKKVLLMFSIRNDNDLLTESGFLKSDINRLCREFKNVLIKPNEEYLNYMINEKETIFEKFLSKWLEEYFATMFEDVRHERSLILLLTLTDSDILKQSKFTKFMDDEINIITNLALEKLHRQRIIKNYVAASLLEKEIE